ncbi:MAG: thiamine/thiamine pyrophosphate ABC transporter permease [Rhizobiaceae bacterium]|nr:thiamine/thiamine pyrophosphate ABC transporter permease [Rhizobiaceae bacterium]
MTFSTLKAITPGLAALGGIALLIGGAFAGLIAEGFGNLPAAIGAFDSWLFRIARFTLWQALLSTLLSVAPAILVARALSRHPAFAGRALILRLFALPLALPAIVAALGILALLGRAGLIAPLWGPGWPGIYGLSGILIAHVFFNLPLATRLLLEALETVPADQWRLAAQLGMNARSTFRLVEWPAMRRALPGVAGLVFMLCVTSFTIVLTLGGGPRATTLEVAIYQSLRFDFDPARAVAVTTLQIVLTALVLAVLARLGANVAGDANLAVSRRAAVSPRLSETLFNAMVLAVAVVLVLSPMAATVIYGLKADLMRLAGEPAVQSATLTSLGLATCSSILCLAMSWSLVAGRQKLAAARRKSPTSLLERMFDTGAGYVLIVPPIVIGSGWFLLLRNHIDVFSVAPIMVAAVNAVMAMPFAIRAIRPAFDAAALRHDKLSAQLGISGWNRLRLIDWPVVRRPMATALAFAMALSLGDLGVIALFGSDAVQTLPYLLLGRMGSYRTDDAAGIALLLGILCLGLMLLADRLGRTAK